MNKKLWSLFLLLVLAPLSLSARERCEENEVFKDNLCWFRAKKKMTLSDAGEFCKAEGYRLPSIGESRALLEQYKGKKVKELGELFNVSGPFFFWVEQEPGSEKVQIVLPGTSMIMDLDPTSKLYVQCVRSPGE